MGKFESEYDLGDILEVIFGGEIVKVMQVVFSENGAGLIDISYVCRATDGRLICFLENELTNEEELEIGK